MIEKESIETFLGEILEGTEIFLVEVKVDNNNRILVHVDKMDGISIEDCVRVSRALEGKLDRKQEDFALEVSSPGLDAAFKVSEQYMKSIGKKVSVNCKDGSKIYGILKEADSHRILLEIPSPKKGGEPGRKDLDLAEILSTRLHIQF